MSNQSSTLFNTHLPEQLFAVYQSATNAENQLSAADKLEMIEKLQLVELIYDSRRFDAFESILT
ncbi:MAG: hypothetical protein AAFR99_07520, partial [Cyanobacteria bacterium J06629_9]